MTDFRPDDDVAVTNNQPEERGASLSFTASDDLVVLSDPNGVRAESISALRTHLIAKHVQQGRRGLTICATDLDEMAPWLAVNLAVSLAQASLRTLLIDCDLRAPRVQRFLTPSADLPGLRHLLENEALSIGDVIQTEVLPELSVMFAGGASANTQELIFGQRFGQALDLCQRDFDITVAVPPPFKSAADSRHVAALLRYALVVTRKDTSLISDVNVMLNELKLDGVRVIGSVYNAF